MEKKTPTSKDMESIVSRRQLTVGSFRATHWIGECAPNQHGSPARRLKDQEGSAGKRAGAAPEGPAEVAQQRVQRAGQSSRAAGEGADGDDEPNRRVGRGGRGPNPIDESAGPDADEDRREAPATESRADAAGESHACRVEGAV